jgi:hypothetical protein
LPIPRQIAIQRISRTRALKVRVPHFAVPALLATALSLLAGCGGAAVTANSTNQALSVEPRITSIDTNCTGCNATNAHGTPVVQFATTSNAASQASVSWSVSGGDASAGPGTINTSGQYTPPSYLSADRIQVLVTATLKTDPGVRATSLITVTPGFLQPLSPANVALGPNGTVTVTAFLAQAGSGAIYFALSDSPGRVSGGEGTLGATACQHFPRTFTSCSVTYSAPAVTQPASVTYVVATTDNSPSKTETAILLNASGVASNPATHQVQLSSPMQFGSSGGNNNDFDSLGNNISDCCSGTLGSLLQDATGRQFLLSNNHVLARSDHASVGDAVVQPGLIDNNCTPNGDGPGTVPVGALTTWIPLRSASTNVDAAIAQTASRSVDPSGNILELGMRQPDGSLAPAPPGVSSSGGKGENATLQLRVAKSGRTTGLTCGTVSALDLDISVDYFLDCAETKPYLTKSYTGQIAVSGDRFGDAGDSGALVVDTANAEPVGLFFAGGTDASGVGHAIANPAADVLNALATQTGTGTSYSFVGASDHPVSCLSFGDSTISSAQELALPDSEVERVQRALGAARILVNPSHGIFGVAAGKSTDRAGEGAVILYVDENAPPPVPPAIDDVRTLIIPTSARAVAFGTAPLANKFYGSTLLPGAVLEKALAIKRQSTRKLLQQNPAFFGIGIGQSLDNPREAALVIYVDRSRVPAHLPRTIAGLRTHYVVMDRLHVTRSYSAIFKSDRRCSTHAASPADKSTDLIRPLSLF